MSELPTPISDQDKLLSNIAIGIPDIEDLIPNSRQEVYLKYIALHGTHELPVSIENGGTGATTVTEARENLGISLPIPIANGGTGATTATEARTNLGITLPIPIANGGTGATTATDARKNLEVRKEFSLYSNSGGSNGSITLSDTYTNYTVIKIYFGDNGTYDTAELYPSMGSKVPLSTSYLYSGGDGWFMHSSILTFSGKTATNSRNGLAQHNTNPGITVSLSGAAGIQVYKILGYKY